jgi:uncharacterized protein YggE
MKFNIKGFQMRYLALAVMVTVSIILAGCSSGSTTQGTGAAFVPIDTISVSGYGEANGKPDMILIQLGVNVVADQVGEAMQESNQVMEEITQALLGVGIAEEDLQTTNFNVWPEDKYDPMTGQSTGERVFHADSTLQVKVRNIDLAPNVIETAVEKGANNIYGLT